MRLALLALLSLTSACDTAGLDGAGNDDAVTVYPAAPVQAEHATLFAFDNVLIPFHQNLYVRMQQPTKHPNNPVLGRGEPGTPDDYRVLFNGTIIRQDGTFRMWYVGVDEEGMIPTVGRPAGPGVYSGHRLAYAESADGIHWTKPNLGLVDYRGNKNNNLVLLEPDLRGNHAAILYEPDDPDPSRRFKMMRRVRSASTEGDADNPLRFLNTTFPMASADGLRWRAAADIKISDYGLLPEYHVFPENFEQSGFYKWQGMYYFTGQQLDPWAWLPDGRLTGRIMTSFHSPDMVHWSPEKAISFVRYGYEVKPKGEGKEAHEAGSMWNRGNVLLATYAMWEGAPDPRDRSMNIGLLISNDGVHFREPQPDFILIPHGPNGAWDDGGLLSGQGFENVGDKTYVYYSMWDLRDPTYLRPAGQLPKSAEGVGLVTLERDRFGCLTPKYPGRDASLLTAPIKLPDDFAITVNAKGLAGGASLRIELLDQRDQPLPAFSGDNAAVVRTSGFNTLVAWPRSPRAPGHPVRLRVTFAGPQKQDIQLYAIYIHRAD